MLIRTIDIDEIKEAIEVYACKKFGIVCKPNIKVCIDYRPDEDIAKQMTVVAKVETDN